MIKKPIVKIYTPESHLRSPSIFIKGMFTDLIRSKDLSWQLAVRDIKTQYRQSILGIIWAFITPLATTITWIFLNKTGIIKLSPTGIPYPLYVFSGTLLWSIFIESLQMPLKLSNAAKNTLSKINFPREAIIISGVYQTLFNGAIKVFLIFITFLIFNIYPNWQILFFPFAFISLILAGTSIGLLITPIGMLYNDIGRVIPLGMQFIMYITPVVFPMPKEGWVHYIFLYNPLTQIIMVCRDWLSGTESNFFLGFLIVNIGVLILLLIAWAIYRAVMPVIIERMNN